MGLSSHALFRALCSDIDHLCPVDGNPLDRVGLTPKQFAASFLRYNCIRKWIPKDTRDADAAAKESFTSANNRCRTWSLSSDLSLFDSAIILQMKAELDNFFHPSGIPLVESYFDLLRRSRPGPGAVVEGLGTSYYTKYFGSQLSTTSEYLYEEYRRYCDWIPSLSEAEAVRRKEIGPVSVVKGSRCCFVPKTSATSRMICIEPSLNMFYQLGLAALLEDRLKDYFRIDLRTQPRKNQLLARQGSVDGTLCTIDLSSASDSISLSLCEFLFPKWFFELLLVLRSHTTEIDGQRVPLYMISTMGNGFTFPLQTIIFSALLRAVSKFHEDIACCTGTWACFGDDLICDSYCYHTVKRILGILGFSLNAAKSFFEGQFRESCGADWLDGQPVRPVYIRKLDLPFDILVAINQLNAWTACTGIPLRNTVEFLMSNLRPKFLNFVPLDSPEDSGIRVHSFFINPNYDGNLSYVYKTWERRPSYIKISEGEIRLPTGKKCLYNPAGLYCSFLFGELESFTIMVRHDLKWYRRRQRVTPNWDHLPATRLANGVSLDQQRWKTALLKNLN